jgi:DNA-binding HxlR family transcriptional regulator
MLAKRTARRGSATPHDAAERSGAVVELSASADSLEPFAAEVGAVAGVDPADVEAAGNVEPGAAIESAAGLAAAESSAAESAAAESAAAPATALRSLCPVANALDLLGDRWTLLVIRDLFADKHRFGDFAASSEHIPTNILAERLKRLERAGLVASEPYQHHPPRFAYSLTPRGRELRPILDALAIWGLEQFPGTRRPARLGGPRD